jgi:hypothetical protein
LLPNLDGKFCLLSLLLTPQNLTESLIEIGKSIIPNSIERLIHKDFCFHFPFDKFNRKDFSNSIKNKLDEIQASTCIYFPETINTENYNVQSFEKTPKT